MRVLVFYLVIFFSLPVATYGQFTTEEIEYANRLDLKNSNSWAIGGGVNNFIMHGDLRSIGTNQLGTFWNFGGYLYVDKMFNPLLGLELKLNYMNISGGSQYLSNIYEVLYVPSGFDFNGDRVTDHTVDRSKLFFDGRAYGAEFNLIFSFSNLYQTTAEKWHAAGYFGVGYHQYNSALYEELPIDVANQFGVSQNYLIDDANFGNNPARNSTEEASSIYLSAQLGIKRRISKRVDIEFRTGMYFNYEDHLDATISNKQDWETYFVSSLGVAIKLGKQKVFTIWGDEEKVPTEQFKVTDTDKDGVIDELDKEPNTPIGVMVYANGVSVDSDGDTVPDHKDKCRFEAGRPDNDGCPFIGDRDKDGIPDRDDKCPEVKGLEKYKGCPDDDSLKLKELVTVLSYSKNIYFDTGSNAIKSAYYYTMLDEVADIMLKNKNVSFSVTGYTDDRGEEKFNLRLSTRRAEQARAYLIAKGVEPDRVTAIGLGEINPKYDNKTEQGRQLNRRVEIKSVGPYTQKTKVILDKQD